MSAGYYHRANGILPGRMWRPGFNFAFQRFLLTPAANEENDEVDYSDASEIG